MTQTSHHLKGMCRYRRIRSSAKVQQFLGGRNIFFSYLICRFFCHIVFRVDLRTIMSSRFTHYFVQTTIPIILKRKSLDMKILYLTKLSSGVAFCCNISVNFPTPELVTLKLMQKGNSLNPICAKRQSKLTSSVCRLQVRISIFHIYIWCNFFTLSVTKINLRIYAFILNYFYK